MRKLLQNNNGDLNMEPPTLGIPHLAVDSVVQNLPRRNVRLERIL
jgi:hypothetical protein